MISHVSFYTSETAFAGTSIKQPLRNFPNEKVLQMYLWLTCIKQQNAFSSHKFWLPLIGGKFRQVQLYLNRCPCFKGFTVLRIHIISRTLIFADKIFWTCLRELRIATKVANLNTRKHVQNKQRHTINRSIFSYLLK